MEILEFCTQIWRESTLHPCAKRSANLTVGTTEPLKIPPQTGPHARGCR